MSQDLLGQFCGEYSSDADGVRCQQLFVLGLERCVYGGGSLYRHGERKHNGFGQLQTGGASATNGQHSNAKFRDGHKHAGGDQLSYDLLRQLSAEHSGHSDGVTRS